MLVDSGKAGQALPIALSVVEATTRVLGADSPRALRAQLNLSSLYARLGRLDETLAMQLVVLEARKRLLGPRPPATISSQVNTMPTLSQAGRPTDSAAMLAMVQPVARGGPGGPHPPT